MSNWSKRHVKKWRLMYISFFLLVVMVVNGPPPRFYVASSTENVGSFNSSVGAGRTPTVQRLVTPAVSPVLSPPALPASQWNTTWGKAWNSTMYADVAAFGGTVYTVTTERITDSLALIISYDSDGDQLWRTTWTTRPNGYIFNVYSLAVDASAVYIVGSAFIPGKGSGTFLAAFDVSDGSSLWSTTFGGTRSEYGLDVVVNSSRLYVAGSLNGGGGTGWDAFVACFNAADGAHMWNVTWATPTEDRGWGVAVNGSYVYHTGYYYNSTLLRYQAFLVQYSHSGVQFWNTTWNRGGFNTYIYSVAANTTGVYLGGTVDHYPQADAVLVKFDATGAEMWNTTYAPTNIYWNGRAITVDGDYIYLVGHGVARLLYGTLVSTNATLLSFNSTGDLQWEVFYKTAGNDQGVSVAVDSGIIYMIGETSIDLNLPREDWGSFFYASMDVFLLRFDVMATPPPLVWDRHLRSNGREYATDATIARGGLYVVGVTENGDQGLDQYLAFLNFTGDLQWELCWGGPAHEIAYSVVQDERYVYVVGIRVNHTSQDLLLSCFTLAGSLQWTTTWDYQGEIHRWPGLDMQLDASRLYVTGTLINMTAPSDPYDVFLACFNTSTGTHIWNTTWGAALNERGWSLAVNGSVIYVGASNIANRNANLVCFDINGNFLWDVTWGEYVEEKVAIATDGSSIYLAGCFYDSSLRNDSFLVSFNATGDEQWNTTWGMLSTWEKTNDLVVDATNIYLAGATTFHLSGYYDAFVVGFNTSGAYQWEVMYDGLGDASALAVAAVDGNFFFTGVTEDGSNREFFLAAWGSGWSGLGDLIVLVEDNLGVAISGASVISSTQPLGQIALSGMTNTSGYAVFNDIRAGVYTLEGSKLGYTDITLSSTVNLLAGDTYQTTLTLRGLCTFVVHVTDRLGIALSDATVISTTQPTGQAALSATTNTTGHVVFTDIFIGTYAFEASKMDYQSNSTLVTFNDIGQTLLIAISLQGIGTIVVQVINSLNAPLPSALVISIIQPTGQTDLLGTTNLTGFVVFADVLVGNYALQASLAGYIPNTVNATVTLGAITPVTILLTQPASPIPGFPLEASLIAITLSLTLVLILHRKPRSKGPS